MATNKSIPYPRNVKEAEVQALLFASLRSLGYDARMEVNNEVYKRGGDTCRFDIVVFLDKLPMCIVEVKSSRVKWKSTWNTAQNDEYRSYGLPYIGCKGVSEMPQAIADVVEVFRNR